MTVHRLPLKVIEGELGSAQFHVSADFDGHAEDFHLDTGATYTSVAFSPVTASYPVTGSTKRMSASGREKTEEKITLREFRLGPIARTHFSVPRYSQENNQSNRLGMNVLAGAHVCVDLVDWQLRFDEAFVGSHFPIHAYVGDTFAIDFRLSGQDVRGLWDTGAELSVVDRDYIKKWPAAFRFIQKIDNGLDATGESVDFELYQSDEIEIGGQVFSGTLMSMDFSMIHKKISPDLQIILGTNLLRGHIWYFDFLNRRWASGHSDQP